MGLGAVAYGRSEQLAFDFGRAPLQPLRQVSDNLYFAVLPDAEAALRMTEVAWALRDRHGLWGRPRPAQLLHVSLAPVDGCVALPQAVVAAAMRVGSAVRAAPFEVTFGRAMSFRNTQKWPLVLRCGRGADALTDLRRALGIAMASAGLSPDLRRDFAPHVTLLYDRRDIPETVLTESISWTVREFVLVHSLHGRSRHIHLGRWPLQG